MIIIGIDSSNRAHINGKFATSINKHSFYALAFMYFGIGKIAKKETYFTTYICNTKIKKNDVIKMELNCYIKTLKFWVNDQMVDDSIIDIDFSNNNVYNMAITSYNKQNSIKIINFTYRHLSIAKSNHC